MKFMLAALWAMLLLAEAAQNPFPECLPDESCNENNDKFVLNKTTFFKDKFIKYRADHTVTNLLVTFNLSSNELMVFFNQIDVKPHGERVELGQFMLVNGTVRKIFDGRCSTSINKLSEQPKIYSGAKDGLYVYNETTKGADKLGTIDDNIVQLQSTYETKELYILTDPDYKIYKVNLEGTEKTLLEAISYAEAFVLDMKNNIYYYGKNRVPYVLNVGNNEVIQFSTFANIESPILVRTSVLVPSGAFFVVGEEIYLLESNGNIQLGPFELKEKLTSIAVDTDILQYYALNNNIYELNFIEIIDQNKDISDYIKNNILFYMSRIPLVTEFNSENIYYLPTP